MNVNAAHQIAADSIETRAAMPSVMPKESWKVTITKLIASSSPPPAYPIAQPRLETVSRSCSVEISGRIASLKTADAAKQRLATRKDAAPSCQLSPVTKKSTAADAAPAQAKPASRSFLREVRSATAPRSGSSTAEMIVEAVMMKAGNAPGAIAMPSTEIRPSTAASSATALM